MTNPTTLHITFKPSPCGGTLIDKTSPEPFVGSVDYHRGQGWLPIESAPRDWTDVLVFDPECESDNSGGVYSAWCDGDGRWFTHTASYNKRLQPTYWQPLPLAPNGGE